MKLSKFDTRTKANAGVEVELLDVATGDPSGAFVLVHGLDSDAYRDYVANRERQILEEASERAASGSPQSTTPADDRKQLEADGCKMLAVLTAGWRGLEDDDGNPLQFSPAAAEALYLGYPTIREQVDRFIARRANFLRA